jgi:hypothetical protein
VCYGNTGVRVHLGVSRERANFQKKIQVAFVYIQAGPESVLTYYSALRAWKERLREGFFFIVVFFSESVLA